MEGDGNQGEGGREALYKVAYEETVRALSEQQMAIDSLRSRAGLLLSAAAITTSFLGSQALKGGDMGPVSLLALTTFIALAAVSLGILSPRKWELAADPGGLIDRLATEGHCPLIEDLHRDLSLKMRSSYVEGWAALGTLSTFLQLASVLLVVEVVLWTIAITVVG
jgi:hypothetical protein